MAKGLRGLAKETAIYGLSSIVGRFLNYMLVPLYTRVMPVEQGGYGVVTEVYAWTAFLLVLLTFGMETAFFRFSNKDGENPRNVYSTTLMLVGGVALLFVAACLLCLKPIAGAMGYSTHPRWIGMMAIVVAMDAFQCIPFAYLRYKKRPWRFFALKMLFIVLNISCNLIYYLAFQGRDIGMVFAINLVCTTAVMLLMLPLLDFRSGFDKQLAQRMLKYAYPILILGIAGILNQVADKMIFKHIYPGNDGETQLGIYGGCVKIAMIMAMLTQAFRYAYEPFVFSKSKDKDSKATYAAAMKYFIISTLLAFLSVIFYMDILKHIIQADYWAGLRVVPIVMAAEMMMGIFFNLSFWYKLIDETKWGAYFSFAGCAVLLTINVLFVPKFGYMACAWAGFAGYAVAMLLSYFVGQKKFPINYNLKETALYFTLAAVCYIAGTMPHINSTTLRLAYRTIILLFFCGSAFFNIYRGIRTRKSDN